MFLLARGDHEAALTKPDFLLPAMIDDGVFGGNVALDLKPDKDVAQLLVLAGFFDGATAIEMALLQIDHEAEADLVGHAHPVGPKRMFRRRKIGIGDDQAGLQAGAVERGIADGAYALRLAGFHQPVP